MEDFYNIKKQNNATPLKKTGCKITSLWVYNYVQYHSDVTEAE